MAFRQRTCDLQESLAVRMILYKNVRRLQRKLNVNKEKLARSSTRLERLTYALIGLTAVLVVLTVRLIVP